MKKLELKSLRRKVEALINEWCKWNGHKWHNPVEIERRLKVYYLTKCSNLDELNSAIIAYEKSNHKSLMEKLSSNIK